MKYRNTVLYIKGANGRYAHASNDFVVTVATEIIDHLYFCPDKTVISNPEAARKHLYMRMHKEHEVFVIMFLDSKHRIIETRELFRGTIDNTSVPIREVVKEAMNVNASAAIVAHNHPSGVTEASMADKQLTESLHLALSMVGVRLLDHFIFGEGGYKNACSLAEMGALH